MQPSKLSLHQLQRPVKEVVNSIGRNGRKFFSIYYEDTSHKNPASRKTILPISQRSRHIRIGKNVTYLRKFHNLTIKKLAAETRLDQGELRRIEKGKVAITPQHLLAFSNYFHVVIDPFIFQDLSREQ
jgi:hypothetical protein